MIKSASKDLLVLVQVGKVCRDAHIVYPTVPTTRNLINLPMAINEHRIAPFAFTAMPAHTRTSLRISRVFAF